MFLVALAGCAQSPVGTLHGAAASEDKAPVVVALIDSGAHPYLPIFRDDEGINLPPIAYQRVEIERTNGSFDAAIENDSRMWDSLEPGTLYHFGGTRVLGISFDDTPRSRPYVLDGADHGTATSYLAAREAPSAIIVVVQVSGEGYVSSGEFVGGSNVRAMEWIADQPWIDIVSISLGAFGNPPTPKFAGTDIDRYLAALDRAAATKLIVNAAGNLPTPAFAAAFGGPPTVIAVGGIESTNAGQAIDSSQVVDVVANYSDIAPENMSGVLGWRSGTSFAAPVVSGTLAHALSLLREVGSEAEIHLLRDALNASAQMIPPTEWQPIPPNRTGDPLQDALRYTSAPILIQPQMGWGYVNGSLAPEIARRVLENDLSIPAGKEQAALFQPRYQQAREEYWARAGP